MKARLAEIQRKADVLMESLTPETRGFVNDKLRDLAAEKNRLVARLEALECAPYKPIDPDAILSSGLAALANLPRLMASGSLEERKEFIHAFVAGITVHPDDDRMDLAMRKLPAGVWRQPGVASENSSVGMVAGAGFAAVQVRRIPIWGQQWVVARAA